MVIEEDSEESEDSDELLYLETQSIFLALFGILGNLDNLGIFIHSTFSLINRNILVKSHPHGLS
ncbi:MAG: hypothetical protein WCV62_03205 [Candidatus Peribacteraceae bacterium]